MIEKREIASVYCITEVDKYGKCKNGFVPLKDIKISKRETLKNKLDAQDQEIHYLKRQVRVLTRAFRGIITSIGGINDDEKVN